MSRKQPEVRVRVTEQDPTAPTRFHATVSMLYGLPDAADWRIMGHGFGSTSRGAVGKAFRAAAAVARTSRREAERRERALQAARREPRGPPRG